VKGKTMIRRTTVEYDIRHTGDEMDRLEILYALSALAKMINDAHLGRVTVSSEKIDTICVTVETIEAP